MEIFNYILSKNPFPNNAYMDEILQRNFCFVDIETTGFSRKKDQVVVIGLLYVEDNQYKLRQYFLESPHQEKKLLTRFFQDLSQFELMITYNGLAFDYPFIQERARTYHLPLGLNHLCHIDLYKHVQANKQTLPIDNYRLKTVESLLGIHRKDQISGSDSILLYRQYQDQKKIELRDQILLHNYEDILYLPLITDVFNYFQKKIFLINSLHHSILLSEVPKSDPAELTFSFKLSDLRFKHNRMILKGYTKTLGKFQEINLFEDQFSFSWSPSQEQYQLEILMQTEILDYATSVDFFNPRQVFSSLPHTDTSILVDNNIIMSVNSKIEPVAAFDIMSNIVQLIYKTFL